VERADVSIVDRAVTNARPRILYLITEDWYFWSHRLDLARAARDAGFDVAVATRVADHAELIRREGFRLFPISLVRRSRNPWRELGAIRELITLYRRERPDLVHHVALKPILYGSLAAWFAGVPVVINAFAGLGYAFTERHRRIPFLRSIIQFGLRSAIKFSRSVVVFQNSEDRDQLIEDGVVSPNRTRVIAGSGIDTNAFAPTQLPRGTPIVLLASRMLWDKGIGDFVAAARILRAKGVPARFVLVGRCDEDNPTAIAQDQLLRWKEEDGVEWWGHRDDMPAVFVSATLVVLPSYREGLPKVLLEAAACAKPIVAADVQGCREVVRDGDTGILVPPKNAQALAQAITTLLQDPALCERMGRRGRDLVVKEFSVERITSETVAFYRELLGPAWHGAAGVG
jgi:glycosyltransferase involved in cell wall biosynthesis